MLIAKRSTIGLIALLLAATSTVAWWRVGLLDLPGVPSNISVQEAGLDHLDELRAADVAIRKSVPSEQSGRSTEPDADTLTVASDQVLNERLAELSRRVQNSPNDLVLANAYRIEVFGLRRKFLNEARKSGEISPQFPLHLDKQPIVFFEELARRNPSRETKLSLALAWVDNMLLFPALEIKAPSSVQSVDILSQILSEPGNEHYVPALFARGLNHLHRPARLVWPESEKTPLDAAAQDIAKCVAIGRKLKVGSKRLQATLAVALGDAYVKANRLNVARSWWQIAQNMLLQESSSIGKESKLMQGIMRRYSWRDEEILDRLEEELDLVRAELDEPMTDLSLMWN